jgi:hypothetical protein
MLLLVITAFVVAVSVEMYLKERGVGFVRRSIKDKKTARNNRAVVGLFNNT